MTRYDSYGFPNPYSSWSDDSVIHATRWIIKKGDDGWDTKCISLCGKDGDKMNRTSWDVFPSGSSGQTMEICPKCLKITKARP